MTEQVVLSDGAPMARSIPCRFCSSYMLSDSFADVYWSATNGCCLPRALDVISGRFCR
jgi:hypothetical protein